MIMYLTDWIDVICETRQKINKVMSNKKKTKTKKNCRTRTFSDKYPVSSATITIFFMIIKTMKKN